MLHQILKAATSVKAGGAKVRTPPVGREHLVWRQTTSRWVLPATLTRDQPGGPADEFGGMQSLAQLPEENGRRVLPGEGGEWAERGVYEASPDFYYNQSDRKRVNYMGREVLELPQLTQLYYNYGYSIVNEPLREGQPLFGRAEEMYLSMKEDMREVGQDYMTYRSWRRDPAYARPEVGEVLASDQFLSTTLDPHYAVTWAAYDKLEGVAYEGNPLWQIRVPKGAKAILAHELEAELTLDAGIMLRCVGVYRGEVVSNGEYGALTMRDVYDMEVIL